MSLGSESRGSSIVPSQHQPKQATEARVWTVDNQGRLSGTKIRWSRASNLQVVIEIDKETNGIWMT